MMVARSILVSTLWRQVLEETTSHTAWPELTLPHGLLADTRIAANMLVRSAAFSTLDYAGGAVRPAIDEPLSLAAIAPYSLEQVAGVRLSQTDADLFYWLLSRAYRGGAPRGNARVYFKRGEALAALGRGRGGKTDVLLDESLARLYQADFKYAVPGAVGRSRLVSCIERFDDDDKPYDYRVTVSDGVAALLDGGEWLVLLGKEREQLAGDPLAKGLHAFYTSHKSAFPMLPSTLKALMGRESMQDSKWRHALDRALAHLKEVTGWVQCEVVKAGPLAGKVVVLKGLKRGKRATKPAAKPGA